MDSALKRQMAVGRTASEGQAMDRQAERMVAVGYVRGPERTAKAVGAALFAGWLLASPGGARHAGPPLHLRLPAGRPGGQGRQRRLRQQSGPIAAPAPLAMPRTRRSALTPQPPRLRRCPGALARRSPDRSRSDASRAPDLPARTAGRSAPKGAVRAWRTGGMPVQPTGDDVEPTGNYGCMDSWVSARGPAGTGRLTRMTNAERSSATSSSPAPTSNARV